MGSRGGLLYAAPSLDSGEDQPQRGAKGSSYLNLCFRYSPSLEKVFDDLETGLTFHPYVKTGDSVTPCIFAITPNFDRLDWEAILLEIIMRATKNYTLQGTSCDNDRSHNNNNVLNRNSFVKINLHRKKRLEVEIDRLCVFRYTIENKIEVSNGIRRGVALRWFPGEKNAKNASAGRRRRRSLGPRGFLNDPYGRRRAKGGPHGARRAGSKSDRRTFTGVFGECWTNNWRLIKRRAHRGTPRGKGSD